MTVGDSQILIYSIIGVLSFLGMLGLIILSYKFKANICRFAFFPSVTSIQKPNVQLLRVVRQCSVFCSQNVNVCEMSLCGCTKAEWRRPIQCGDRESVGSWCTCSFFYVQKASKKIIILLLAFKSFSAINCI